MNILLIAATEAEIAPSREYIAREGKQISEHIFAIRGKFVEFCVTGVGMVATTYWLTKALRNTYDMVLQVGVGGSFDRSINLGEVVFVKTEHFGDLGAEDNENYLSIFDLHLLEKNTFPFSNTALENPLTHIGYDVMKVAKGLTVNTVSGNQNTIDAMMQKYNCQVESMEGAAFHYVCLMEQIEFAQVRAISNYVEPRDKSKWQMRPAIENLNTWIKKFINTLQ